jgi:signal transduction histidine kinase
MSTLLRVLTVEDSENDALFILHELRKSGYDVTSQRVDTPESMNEALNEKTWDIVISDYAMPRFSMPAALSMVQEKGLDLPFIIVSGAIGEEAAVAAMRAGASDYVMKGNLARLVPAVERELREAEIRRERRRAEEALRQSEKLRALGEMASGVAHDFNNVLAIILGRAQLALEDLVDPQADKAKRSIQVIEQSALDAARTVRRLQEFTRVKRARPFEMVNLNQLLEGALEMVESRRVELNETKGITIEIDATLDAVAPVAGDAAELREALLNILFNAMDAMPDGGTIKATSERKNGSVAISISDTGMGIPEDIKGKLFDPFFTTKAAKGSGLGLSVTYGIVSRHGGSIEVDSALGKGATFTIKLPVAEGVQEGARPERTSHAIKCSKILLVDDEPEVIDILGIMLQQLGHQVTGVTSGGEALSAFKKGVYELVITDLGMPDITGFDVAKAVKEIKPETPVMLITGWGVQINTEELPEIDGVIEKPFSKDTLLKHLSEICPPSSHDYPIVAM